MSRYIALGVTVTNGVKLTENHRSEFVDWFVKRIEDSRC